MISLSSSWETQTAVRTYAPTEGAKGPSEHEGHHIIDSIGRRKSRAARAMLQDLQGLESSARVCSCDRCRASIRVTMTFGCIRTSGRRECARADLGIKDYPHADVAGPGQSFRDDPCASCALRCAQYALGTRDCACVRCGCVSYADGAGLLSWRAGTCQSKSPARV